MGFEVNIENFEGPLDLMLHLIKQNKLDLFDLDMDILADQYINYIETMQNMQLEVASEFLVELASLLEYKSKKLLPKEKVEIEEEYEENQIEKLRQRLIEYKQFKEVTPEFDERYQHRQKMLDKPVSKICDKWVKDIKVQDYEGNPYDLIKAMNRALRRYELSKPQQVTLNVYEISTDDRMDQIKERLLNFDDVITLEELCEDCDSLHMVITTFLASLVLIKDGYFNFSIKDEVIYLQKGGLDE